MGGGERTFLNMKNSFLLIKILPSPHKSSFGGIRKQPWVGGEVNP
jgi:hypothetical protein